MNKLNNINKNSTIENAERRIDNNLKLDIKNYNKNSQFSYYITGLIEGDSCIMVPYSAESKKKRYPVVKITFAEKDFPLAYKLSLLIPFSKIYKEKGKYYNLTIYKLSTLFLIVYLINGKMRTPKIEALNRLIDWFNLNYNVNLDKFNLDTSTLKNNAWLAGFLDCDSSFSCFYNLNNFGIAKDIHCYMSLSQRQIYKTKRNILNNDTNGSKKLDNNSYFNIMEKIKILFNVKGVRIIKRIRKNNIIELGYEIRTSKKESNELLINYLNNFPLFSSKYLDFLDWKNILNIRNNRQYKENQGTNLLISLKSNMNNNRINFNWEHLDSFWKT